jgi:hypothetical protein
MGLKLKEEGGVCSTSPGETGESSGAGSHSIRLAGSNLGDRAHICAFFNSREEAYRVLLPFVQEGLESGQKAVHTVDPRRREEHVRWLASAGIDVDKNNQIELRDWADSHLNGGLFNQDKTLALWERIVADAKEKGFPLVRFVSEMEWALEADLHMNDLLEYEAKANYVWLRGDGPYNPAICTYDLKRFRGDIVIDVMRTHPLAIIGGVLQENPFFAPPDEFLEQLRKKRDTV